jgi:hypothetical protein
LSGWQGGRLESQQSKILRHRPKSKATIVSAVYRQVENATNGNDGEEIDERLAAFAIVYKARLDLESRADVCSELTDSICIRVFSLATEMNGNSVRALEEATVDTDDVASDVSGEAFKAGRCIKDRIIERATIGDNECARVGVFKRWDANMGVGTSGHANEHILDIER